MPIDYALLTDLYEITMAQGYRDSGHENTEACFHMYFRDTPFKGGYAIACGMAQLADMVDTYAFSGEDIDYLSKIPAPGGGALFAADFLEWLRDFKLTVDIDAVPEGQVVFPNEPLVRVKGPIMQCQLLEAALLNCVNFQTLIATKAARVCLAAESPVAEFGLRRLGHRLLRAAIKPLLHAFEPRAQRLRTADHAPASASRSTCTARCALHF